jgi:Na+/H+ antiporter NhaD/arsenite permease-like protein
MGATVLCISSDRIDVEELMHLVEWDMLIFFAALFCMVEGAVEVGLIDMIGGFLASIIRSAPPEARRIVAIEILLWLSAIISGECDLGFCVCFAGPCCLAASGGPRA